MKNVNSGHFLEVPTKLHSAYSKVKTPEIHLLMFLITFASSVNLLLELNKNFENRF